MLLSSHRTVIIMIVIVIVTTTTYSPSYCTFRQCRNAWKSSFQSFPFFRAIKVIKPAQITGIYWVLSNNLAFPFSRKSRDPFRVYS